MNHLEKTRNYLIFALGFTGLAYIAGKLLIAIFITLGGLLALVLVTEMYLRRMGRF